MPPQENEEQLSWSEVKEKGNEAVRAQRYEEAVLHYSHAIKLNPKDYSLYSNRSLAFLKMQMYYFAMEDANETINLNPTWPKGYFRRAEVEFATFHYSDALLSYTRALELKLGDMQLLECIKRTSKEHQKDLKADDQIPWVGAGIGIVLGVIIVIADFLYTNKPTLTHPVLMALVTISIAMIGYGIAKGFRYYVKCQREAMLQPPLSLDSENSNSSSDAATGADKSTSGGAPTTKDGKEKTNNRYTKSQARQRYKKGKM